MTEHSILPERVLAACGPGKDTHSTCDIDVPMAVAASLLCCLFTATVISSLVFVAGGRLSSAILVVALSAGLGVAWSASPRAGRTAAVAGYVCTLLMALGLARLTVDSSYDGNTYHKVAVGALALGWNPVHESTEDFWSGSRAPFQLVPQESGTPALWVNHYPKTTWVVGALVYKATGHIEAGKVMGPITAAVAGLIAFALARRRISMPLSAVIALLAAGTPVVLVQMTSYYIDGVLGSLVVATVLLLSFIIDPAFNRPAAALPACRLRYAMLTMALALLVDVKFSGLVMAVLYPGCYFMYLALRPRSNWRTLIGLATSCIAALVLGMGLLGTSSYVKNLLDHGNPLYPLYGAGSKDILTPQEPAAFRSESGAVAFVRSMLSKTDNSVQHDPQFKIPFTFDVSQLRESHYLDTRVAGYGVWFGGICLLCVLAGVVAVRLPAVIRRPATAVVLLPVIATSILVVAMPGSWWARYVPQLGALPVIAVAVLASCNRMKLAWGMVALIAANAAVFGYFQAHDIGVTVLRPAPLSDLAARGDGVVIYASRFNGAVFNFLDAGVHPRALSAREYAALPPDDFYDSGFPPAASWLGIPGVLVHKPGQ